MKEIKSEKECSLWCKGKNRLCKAHLLPKWAYTPLLRDDAPLKMYTEDEYSKRVQEGVYDNNILCAECDRTIGTWDDSFSLLNNDIISASENSLLNGPSIVFKHLKPAELKLFGLSLLYRFAISEHRMAERVNIGPFLESLRSMIIENRPGEIDDFSMAIIHETKREKTFIVNPAPFRRNGLNSFSFFFPYCTVVIKVDSRPLPKHPRSFAIGESQNIEILINHSPNPSQEQLNMDFLTKAMKKNRKPYFKPTH